MKTNRYSLYFDIITQNFHQKLEIIVLGNGKGLTQLALVPLFMTIKTNKLSPKP